MEFRREGLKPPQPSPADYVLLDPTISGNLVLTLLLGKSVRLGPKVHNSIVKINRIREFGSRRVEQLWEGYDRSITALRTFTLEQRMRILKQYKVKQRYVNKLLEAIAAETNAEQISRKVHVPEELWDGRKGMELVGREFVRLVGGGELS